MSEYLKLLLIWLACGIFVFNILVIILFKSRLVSETRNENGHLKKKQSFKGIVSISTVILIFIIIIYFFDLSIFHNGYKSSLSVFLLNFIFVMAFVFYDSFVIDLLVIGKIRPSFLNLPASMDMNSMKEHVKRQFSIGWIYVIPLIIIPSILFILIN